MTKGICFNGSKPLAGMLAWEVFNAPYKISCYQYGKGPLFPLGRKCRFQWRDGTSFPQRGPYNELCDPPPGEEYPLKNLRNWPMR